MSTVSLKARAAVRAGLTPLICEACSVQDAIRVCLGQALEVIGALPSDSPAQIAFAYEPAWAIWRGGTRDTRPHPSRARRHSFRTAAWIRGKSADVLAPYGPDSPVRSRRKPTVFSSSGWPAPP